MQMPIKMILAFTHDTKNLEPVHDITRGRVPHPVEQTSGSRRRVVVVVTGWHGGTWYIISFEVPNHHEPITHTHLWKHTET